MVQVIAAMSVWVKADMELKGPICDPKMAPVFEDTRAATGSNLNWLFRCRFAPCSSIQFEMHASHSLAIDSIRVWATGSAIAVKPLSLCVHGSARDQN